MEEEGIYYFFKFTKGAHKLVLANTAAIASGHAGRSAGDLRSQWKAAKERTIEFRAGPRNRHWGSGKYTLWDHHFQLPHKKLDAEQIVMDSVQAGKDHAQAEARRE